MVYPSSAGFQFLSFLISVSRSFCPTHQNILVSVVFFARKLVPSKITTLIIELASPTAEAKLYWRSEALYGIRRWKKYRRWNSGRIYT